MTRTLNKLVAVLQVTRAALLFTAVSDIWLIVFMADANRNRWPLPEDLATLPLWAWLLCTAVVAGGLYLFGMALNDVMDVRRDRIFAPDRPIPSRRISQAAVMAIAVGALLAAVGASIPLGELSTLMCLITAGLILFYNAIAKHLGGVGIVTLGLVRAVNMLIANPAIVFLWPVWVTMTYVTGLSAAAHRLEGKRPRLIGAQVWIVSTGWAFVTVVMALWMHRHHAPPADRPWMWVGPAAALVVFAGIGVVTGMKAPSEAAAGGLLMKRGLLWLFVLDASWLASDWLWWQAGVAIALLLAAFIAMKLTRHLKAMAAPTDFPHTPHKRHHHVQPKA